MTCKDVIYTECPDMGYLWGFKGSGCRVLQTVLICYPSISFATEAKRILSLNMALVCI
jgi:hypothetical protein